MAGAFFLREVIRAEATPRVEICQTRAGAKNRMAFPPLKTSLGGTDIYHPNKTNKMICESFSHANEGLNGKPFLVIFKGHPLIYTGGVLTRTCVCVYVCVYPPVGLGLWVKRRRRRRRLLGTDWPHNPSR